MKKLVLVDVISQFRIRYVVEVEDNIEDALDQVVFYDDLEELSQLHLGHQIFSHREITTDEYFKIFDQDNDYLKSWSPEQKLKFINKINYGDEDDFTDSGNEA